MAVVVERFSKIVLLMTNETEELIDMRSQCKAILFDIGGVLWHPTGTPLSANWAARCGLSVAAFDQVVYNSEWGAQALVGKISGAEMWQKIGKQLGLSPAETDECQKEYWAGDWDIDLLTYCRELKSRYKLGILSDAESNAREMVQTWVNDELFDVIVFSSEVGVCKPDPYIFQHALARLGVESAETLFLDDRKKNILGAKVLGMSAILYENPNQALALLKQHVLGQTSPPCSSEDLQQFVTNRQITAEIIHLPSNTLTVAEAAAVLGVGTEQIIKSVLFLAEGRPVLAIGCGLGRLDWKRLADYLGVSRRRLKSATAVDVQAITGYVVGSVPPFGHRQPLRTVVDARVYDQPFVYGGGGDINALLRLETAELRRVVGPETAVL